MREWKGLDIAVFQPEHRKSMEDVSIFLHEVSAAVKRLGTGLQPQVSSGSTPAIAPTALDNYFYLPGRAGGQTAYGGTGASDTLTLKATNAIGTGGNSVILKSSSASTGSSNDVLFLVRDSTNVSGASIASNGATILTDLRGYVFPGGNPEMLRVDTRHTSGGAFGSTAFRVRGSETGATFYEIINASLNMDGRVELSGGAVVTERHLDSNADAACVIQIKDGFSTGSVVGAKTLIVKQFAGQTGRLTEWQNTAGTVQASVSTAGVFTGDGSGLTNIGGIVHPLLDGSNITDSVASTVARGDVIVGNSTPKWARLPLGAAGKVLSSDGADASWSADLAVDSATIAGAVFIADASGVQDMTINNGAAGTATLSFVGTTAGGVYTVPAGGGTFFTTASSNVFTGGNTTIRCNTGAGTTFTDVSSTTKQMRFDLTGITAGTIRNKKWGDQSGTVVLVGNTAAASGVLGTIALTAQTANLTAQTMLTGNTTSAGLYRLSFYLKTTTAGTPAVAQTKVTVAWNDGTAQTIDVPFITGAPALAIQHDLGTANAFSQGSVVVKAAASQNITFTTTGTYTGSPQYSIDCRIEAL